MTAFQEIGTRSYTFEEILTKSIREVLGRRFLEYFLPVLILTLIFGAIYLPIMDGMRDMMRASIESGRAYSGEGPFSQEDFWRQWLQAMGGGLLCMLLGVPVVLYVLRRMRANIMGEATSFGQTLREAVDPLRCFGLIISSLIVGIAVWIATLFLIVPGIILSVYFAFIPACVALDGSRFSVPLTRPFNLVSGKFGKTLGVFAILCAIFFVIGMIVTLPVMIVQMSESGLFGTEDPEAAALDYYDSFLSTPFLIVQALAFFVQATFSLLLGCATVIMFLNYQLVPAAAPPPAPNLPSGSHD